MSQVIDVKVGRKYAVISNPTSDQEDLHMVFILDGGQFSGSPVFGDSEAITSLNSFKKPVNSPGLNTKPFSVFSRMTTSPTLSLGC
ncbi:hypothetical protein DRO57_04145 [Candidatus Bathyarchaeota archaeon]|nr:MAG: hypothetical protein DRO57_04145 [Candidatus Bathyarchaeota archaeon]